MFNLLSKTRYGRIGLDIGAEGVKMLQLAVVRSRPFIAAAALRHLPESAAGSDPQTRRRLVVENIREMLKSGEFRGRDVVSCLRTDEIVVKNVRLPRMPENELASAAVWECKERFGFEVAPDRIHCIKAGEVRQGAETRDEVILIAAPDESIRRHLEMLSEMRLRPAHIEAEPTALFRAYERFLRRAEDNSAVTVLVDIGLSATKVVVARGRTILLIKTIDIAGRKFNESVAEELNMNYAEAASVRMRTFENGPVEPDGASETKLQWSVFDAIREQVEALAREISLCLRYCSVTFRGLRANRITLTGGEAYDQHLGRSLTEYLDCECVIGQPLYGIDVGGVEMNSDRRGELTEWSVATGLALRGLDGKTQRGSSYGKALMPAPANSPDVHRGPAVVEDGAQLVGCRRGDQEDGL